MKGDQAIRLELVGRIHGFGSGHRVAPIRAATWIARAALPIRRIPTALTGRNDEGFHRGA